MKPAGLLLLLPAGLGMLEGAEPSPAQLSDRLRTEIRTSLPKYVEPPAAPAPLEPAPVPDADLLVLPKITIQEKRVPGHDPDTWLSERTVQQKAMAAYKGSMTDLEWALNSWFIPLFSAPASVRARAAYADNKLTAEMDRLYNVIKAIEVSDPSLAARLRRSMDPNVHSKD